jgi:hypothetical protein
MYMHHLKKHGIIDQIRRQHGPAFDKKHAEVYRMCGWKSEEFPPLSPDEPPVPAPV